MNNDILIRMDSRGHKWLTKRWYQERDKGNALNQHDIDCVIDWFNANIENDYFSRKFHKYTWKVANDKQRKWHLSFSKKKIADGSVQEIERFDSDYYIVKIQDQQGLDHESSVMGHCIKTYCLDRNNIYSLRKNDKSIITFCFSTMDNKFEMKEKYNKLVSAQNLNICLNWLMDEFDKRKRSKLTILEHTEGLDTDKYLYQNKSSARILTVEEITSCLSERDGILLGASIQLKEEQFVNMKCQLNIKDIILELDDIEKKRKFHINASKLTLNLSNISNVDLEFSNQTKEKINLSLSTNNRLSNVSITSFGGDIDLSHDLPIDNLNIKVFNEGQVKCTLTYMYTPSLDLKRDATSAIFLKFQKCWIKNITYQKDICYEFNSCIGLDTARLTGYIVYINNMNLTGSLSNIDTIKLTNCNIEDLDSISSKILALEEIKLYDNLKIYSDEIQFTKCSNIFFPECRKLTIFNSNLKSLDLSQVKSDKLLLKKEDIVIFGSNKDLSLEIKNAKVLIVTSLLSINKLFVTDSKVQIDGDLYCNALFVNYGCFFCGNIKATSNIVIGLTHGNEEKTKVGDMYSEGNILFFINTPLEQNKVNFEYQKINADWHIVSPYPELLDETATLINAEAKSPYYIQMNQKEWKKHIGFIGAWSIYNINGYDKYITQDDGRIYAECITHDESRIKLKVSAPYIRYYIRQNLEHSDSVQYIDNNIETASATILLSSLMSRYAENWNQYKVVINKNFDSLIIEQEKLPLFNFRPWNNIEFID